MKIRALTSLSIPWLSPLAGLQQFPQGGLCLAETIQSKESDQFLSPPFPHSGDGSAKNQIALLAAIRDSLEARERLAMNGEVIFVVSSFSKITARLSVST